MHEFGIIHNIEDQVRQLLTKHDATRPTRIVVKASEQDALSRESMEFAFQHMIDEAGWQGAELDLQIEPAKATCTDCNQTFEYQPNQPNCPHCGSDKIKPEPSPGPILQSVEME